MTPEEARQAVRRMQNSVLVAEAESVAEGWRFLTIDGIAVEDQPSMELYDQVIAAFRDVVGLGRQGRHDGTSSSLTLGIRSSDADARIRTLREHLDALNPSAVGQRWTFRESMQ